MRTSLSGVPLLLHELHASIPRFPFVGRVGCRLSKSRQVIAVEMQRHGRTADIDRDFSYGHLADDIAALLDRLKIKRADVLGYSIGRLRRKPVNSTFAHPRPGVQTSFLPSAAQETRDTMRPSQGHQFQ